MDINVNPVYHDDVLCHAAVIHLTKRKSRFVYQEEFSRYTEDGEEAASNAMPSEVSGSRLVEGVSRPAQR